MSAGLAVVTHSGTTRGTAPGPETGSNPDGTP
jgi:hypothetical protein